MLTMTICPVCKGRGWVYSAMHLGGDKPCKACNGTGLKPTK